MQFTQLLLVYHVGGFAHHVVGVLGLGERNYVADGGTFCHQHDHAVQAEGQSSVGRRAVFKGLHHEAELFLSFFVRKANGFKNGVLHVAAVDTDGAASQFHAVQHHVIGFSVYLARIGLQHGQVFVAGGRKGMVHSYPAFFILVPLEHGEPGHPCEA